MVIILHGVTTLGTGAVGFPETKGTNANGGTVTAKDGSHGAGIGGGNEGAGGTIKILGGHVIAGAGEMCVSAVGAGDGASDADITLGWTDSTDRIIAISYKGTVQFDKSFIFGDDNTLATADNITGKTLVPAYKVTFKAEGIDDIIKGVPATGEATVESLALTNDNNEVAIWYADEQRTVKADFTKPITEDTTFYGKWVPCGIFFDTDGGSEIDPITDVSAKQRIAKPENPTKEGHTFQYWTLDGKKVTFPYTVPATYDGTSQIIFKAVWKTNTYKVTFNTNGGSAVRVQTVEYTKTAEEPNAPTKKKCSNRRYGSFI